MEVTGVQGHQLGFDHGDAAPRWGFSRRRRQPVRAAFYRIADAVRHTRPFLRHLRTPDRTLPRPAPRKSRRGRCLRGAVFRGGHPSLRPPPLRLCPAYAKPCFLRFFRGARSRPHPDPIRRDPDPIPARSTTHPNPIPTRSRRPGFPAGLNAASCVAWAASAPARSSDLLPLPAARDFSPGFLAKADAAASRTGLLRSRRAAESAATADSAAGPMSPKAAAAASRTPRSGSANIPASRSTAPCAAPPHRPSAGDSLPNQRMELGRQKRRQRLDVRRRPRAEGLDEHAGDLRISVPQDFGNPRPRRRRRRYRGEPIRTAPDPINQGGHAWTAAGPKVRNATQTL